MAKNRVDQLKLLVKLTDRAFTETGMLGDQLGRLQGELAELERKVEDEKTERKGKKQSKAKTSK